MRLENQKGHLPSYQGACGVTPGLGLGLGLQHSLGFIQ